MYNIYNKAKIQANTRRQQYEPQTLFHQRKRDPKINSRLLSISLSKDEKDWPSVLHTHPFTEIFFVLNGKGNFFFRRDIRPIETGDLIIIPPYLEHTEQSIPGTPLEYYVLGIDGIAFQEEDQSSTAQIFCNFDNVSLIRDLFCPDPL